MGYGSFLIPEEVLKVCGKVLQWSVIVYFLVTFVTYPLHESIRGVDIIAVVINTPKPVHLCNFGVFFIVFLYATSWSSFKEWNWIFVGNDEEIGVCEFCSNAFCFTVGDRKRGGPHFRWKTVVHFLKCLIFVYFFDFILWFLFSTESSDRISCFMNILLKFCIKIMINS